MFGRFLQEARLSPLAMFSWYWIERNKVIKQSREVLYKIALFRAVCHMLSYIYVTYIYNSGLTRQTLLSRGLASSHVASSHTNCCIETRKTFASRFRKHVYIHRFSTPRMLSWLVKDRLPEEGRLWLIYFVDPASVSGFDLAKHSMMMYCMMFLLLVGIWRSFLQSKKALNSMSLHFATTALLGLRFRPRLRNQLPHAEAPPEHSHNHGLLGCAE